MAWRDDETLSPLVRERLDQAIASGQLAETPEGCLTFPAPDASRQQAFVARHLDLGGRPSCQFLNEFLFQIVHKRQRIPHGCQDCFKVKVTVRNVRQLAALRGIAQALPYMYKCGAAVNNPYTRSIYRCVFYARGLDAAREIHHQVASRVQADLRLGEQVDIAIKRGCSEYEVFVGPSDAWRFEAADAVQEQALLRHFERPKSGPVMAEPFVFMKWLGLAHMLGDDTYLDFTGGKRLFPDSVRYDP